MQNLGLLIFRVSIGTIMLAAHGWPKLMRSFSGQEIKFYDFLGIGAAPSLYLAVFSEFFLSILLIFGVFTRFSSLGMIITMFVAFFLAHADDPFSQKEKALLFLISYITLFFTGPGKFVLQSYFESKIKISNKFIKLLLS